MEDSYYDTTNYETVTLSSYWFVGIEWEPVVLTDFVLILEKPYDDFNDIKYVYKTICTTDEPYINVKKRDNEMEFIFLNTITRCNSIFLMDKKIKITDATIEISLMIFNMFKVGNYSGNGFPLGLFDVQCVQIHNMCYIADQIKSDSNYSIRYKKHKLIYDIPKNIDIYSQQFCYTSTRFNAQTNFSFSSSPIDIIVESIVVTCTRGSRNITDNLENGIVEQMEVVNENNSYVWKEFGDDYIIKRKHKYDNDLYIINLKDPLEIKSGSLLQINCNMRCPEDNKWYGYIYIVCRQKYNHDYGRFSHISHIFY